MISIGRSFGLKFCGNLAGKTFAYSSKKISKMAEDRPNDPIARKGQDLLLNRLKMANDDAIEEKKFADESQQFMYGGECATLPTAMRQNIFKYGGYQFKDF